jgi:hypothetical protein
VTTRRGLVLSVGTPQAAITIKTERDRIADIQRLVEATIPLLQFIKWNADKLDARRQWCIDNVDHPRYDEREVKTRELELAFASAQERYYQNARAARVQAMQLSPQAKKKVYDLLGVDYRQTTGDQPGDFDRQWADVVEILTDECPF